MMFLHSPNATYRSVLRFIREFRQPSLLIIQQPSYTSRHLYLIEVVDINHFRSTDRVL